LGVPKTYWKKKFDFNGFTEGKYRAMSTSELEQFYTYAEYDIYALAFVLLKLESMMQVIYPIPTHEVDFHVQQSFRPRTTFSTLQSLIRSVLRTHYFSSPYEFTPNHFIPYDNMLLSALRGGCVQTTCLLYKSSMWEQVCHMWTEAEPDVVEGKEVPAALPDEVVQLLLDPQHMETTLTAIDATSLYPTILSFCLMPRGSGHYMDEVSSQWFMRECCKREYGRRNWGIFLVCITHIPIDVRALPFGLLSYRRKKGHSMLYCNAMIHDLSVTDRDLLDMDYIYQDEQGRYYTFYTTDHLAVYAMAGIVYHAAGGIAWKDEDGQGSMSTSYKEFIDRMFEERVRNKDNPVLNQLYKLVMNGAFGSSGMRMIDGKHIIINEKQFSIDDTDDVPVIHYTIQHRHTDVAKVKNIIPIMKDELGLPHQLLVQLKALKGHAFNALSCKSTCTSRVTSAAYRYMMETLQDGGATHCPFPLSFTSMLRHVHYMDTDSLFLPTPIAHRILALSPYCHTNKLGSFKDDCGGPILYMTAPMAKVRKMAVLKKGKHGKYGIQYITKFKGLPLGAAVHHSVFETMMQDLTLDENKTVWQRSLHEGVSTSNTSYSVDLRNMFLQSKSGFQIEREGVVRLLPPYHANEQGENRKSMYFAHDTQEGESFKEMSFLFS
jgi:hypothetical protein